MKRMHVHVTVQNVDESIVFYSGLFGQDPTIRQNDYAKWVVEDPCVNFAISTRDANTGFDHLGIQVDTEEELEEIETRLRKADADVREQRAAACCYAVGEKSWTFDPEGIAWETFLTTGTYEEYGSDRRPIVGRNA
ncbi:MAG: ArsI/CadI family heavy metal resistance metalloenzyme [Alphaproteobacteria bacterium]